MVAARAAFEESRPTGAELFSDLSRTTGNASLK